MKLYKRLFNIEYDPEKHGNRLLKYKVLGMKVLVRPENHGKEITDALPQFQKIELDQIAMDIAANTDVLMDLPGKALNNKLAMVAQVLFPKWVKRGKVWAYGGPIFLGVLKMKLIQPILRLFMPRRKKETDLETVKQMIQDYAENLGYIMGITRLDRRFVSGHNDKIQPFNTVIVLGMEMDFDLCEDIPYPQKELFDFETYAKSSRLVWQVAKYIRKLGYPCHVIIPLDGGVKFVPHAINAGLGELGAQGICITRKYGPRVRWCMIGIDADLPVDQPVDLHLADYCDDCLLCVEECPGHSIYKNRFWYKGVLKRKSDHTKCFPNIKKYEGCGICIKVCPFNRFGYDACMEAWEKDGTILSEPLVSKNLKGGNIYEN